MKRENSFGGRGKKREELRKWTILVLLFAGLAVLGYCLDRFVPSPDDILGPAVQTTAPIATDAYRETIQVKITGNSPKPGVYTMREGSRVKDLVEKAGGLPDGYDKTQLPISLLSELFDGQLVVIP